MTIIGGQLRMMDESAFDAALAEDVEHSARMVKTAAGGVLQVDGRAVPPILYKPIPFGADVTNLKTSEKMRGAHAIPLDMTGGETRWFSLKRGCE